MAKKLSKKMVVELAGVLNSAVKKINGHTPFLASSLGIKEETVEGIVGSTRETVINDLLAWVKSHREDANLSEIGGFCRQAKHAPPQLDKKHAFVKLVKAKGKKGKK